MISERITEMVSKGHGHVKLSDAANDQYELINKEIGKLCELTCDDWGLINEKWFNKVNIMSALLGGAVGGVVVGGIVEGIHLYKKHRNKDKKES